MSTARDGPRVDAHCGACRPICPTDRDPLDPLAWLYTATLWIPTCAMITLTPLAFPAELREVEEFLTAQHWPFHVNTRLDSGQVTAMALAPPETASFWVMEDGARVGLVRLQDLQDIGDGSPVFDLRIAAEARGRGVGRVALRLLCDHAFSRWPELHRIEGTTRDDNVAMQRVFEACHFQREGRLRETWPGPQGRWHDTLIYGLLRREWLDRPGSVEGFVS